MALSEPKFVCRCLEPATAEDECTETDGLPSIKEDGLSEATASEGLASEGLVGMLAGVL